MPIPVESPPPIVCPTRGDSFFDQQGEKIKGPCIQVNRDFGVKGSLGAVRYAEQARFWKNESRSKQFIPRGREKTTVFPRSHADFEGQSLAGPQTQKKLTTESVIETVNSLGQITADLGGQSFIPKTESVTGLREAKSLLTEQIEAFSQGVLELTAGGQLNPQRLKEMSRLDFSGKELGSLQPLVEGLSPKKMAGLRKEIRGLMEKMEENSFDTSKLEEGLEKFFSGKNLNAALLAVAGLTAFASINNLDKRRLKQIGLVLLFAVLTTCCGSSDKTLLSTATATTAAATNTAASTEVVSSPTPEIADIVETPAAATEAVSFIPPNNPPIYQEIGSGGPLPETNPLGAGFNRSRYVLLAHEGVIIDQSQYSSYEELVEAINQQAESKNIDVIQAVSFDGQQTLSMAVRTYADGKRMFIWLADADSKLLGARSDIPPSENFIEGEVVIPKEFKDFQLKIVPGEDNNFYLYLVGVDGKAIAWFWQSDGYIDESSADNQVVNAWHWVDENGVAQFDKNVIFGAGGAQVVDETEKVLLNFDLVKKAWVEALPPLPEQFSSQIPADKQYKIVNGQVLVDGQAWFEMNSAGEWEKSDWKLLADAPNQNFWGGKYEIERVLRQDIWPLLTGENWEVTKEINGQPVVIKGRLGVIPNPYQKGEILKVLIPFRFEWGDGLSSNVWVITKTEEKNIDYFLQLPSGEQVFITGTVDSSHRPAECVFGTRCGWWYDIADLSADFFLNGVTPDEPVIVSPVTIEVK